MYPFLKLGPYVFYTFGVCAGLGVAASYFAFKAYYERRLLPVSAGFFLALVIPFGFFCARLDDAFLNHRHGAPQLRGPLHQVIVGGYTYFGGLLGAFLLWLLIIKLRRWPMLPTLDGLFCAGVGYACGRVGCFFAGDGDYGVPTNLPWAVSFPHGMVPTTARVHPTMLYTAAWELVLFVLLWRFAFSVRGRSARPGTLLGLYLCGTALGRFFIEFTGRNTHLAFGLTEAQLVGLALFLAGASLLAAKRSNFSVAPVRSGDTSNE